MKESHAVYLVMVVLALIVLFLPVKVSLAIIVYMLGHIKIAMS